MLNTKRLASGFTLIELLVVIAIIANASDNDERQGDGREWAVNE